MPWHKIRKKCKIDPPYCIMYISQLIYLEGKRKGRQVRNGGSKLARQLSPVLLISLLYSGYNLIRSHFLDLIRIKLRLQLERISSFSNFRDKNFPCNLNCFLKCIEKKRNLTFRESLFFTKSLRKSVHCNSKYMYSPRSGGSVSLSPNFFWEITVASPLSQSPHLGILLTNFMENCPLFPVSDGWLFPFNVSRVSCCRILYFWHGFLKSIFQG